MAALFLMRHAGYDMNTGEIRERWRPNIMAAANRINRFAPEGVTIASSPILRAKSTAQFVLEDLTLLQSESSKQSLFKGLKSLLLKPVPQEVEMWEELREGSSSDSQMGELLEKVNPYLKNKSLLLLTHFPVIEALDRYIVEKVWNRSYLQTVDYEDRTVHECWILRFDLDEQVRQLIKVRS